MVSSPQGQPLQSWESGSSQLQTVRAVILGPDHCCIQNSGQLWMLAEECRSRINLQWCLAYSCGFLMHKSKHCWSICISWYFSTFFPLSFFFSCLLGKKRYCIAVNQMFVSGLGNSHNNWLWRQSSPDMDWEDNSFLFFSICYIFLCSASGK